MAAPDTAPTLSPPPVDGEVLSTTHPQHLVALAHDAAEFTRVRGFLKGLTMAGHEVALVWLTGAPTKELGFLENRRQIHPGLRRSPAALRQLASTPREHWRGDRTDLVDATRLDPAGLGLLEWADGVMAFGDRAKAAIDQLVEGRSVRVPHRDLRGWAGLSRVWTDFRTTAHAGALTPRFATELADRVDLLRDPAPAEVEEELTDFLTELTRSGHHQEALRLLPAVPEDMDTVKSARRRALFTYARTSAAGREDPDLRDSVAGLLPAIDHALEAGDLAHAATLTTLALGLLFHVEVHADKLATPLVEESEDYLGAWRASRVGQVLARPTPRQPRRSAEPDQGTHQVVVFRGSYPRFSAQLIEELSAQPHTEVVVHEWTGRGSTVKGLGVRPEPVEDRLRQALGEEVLDEELSALFDGANALFIDWADRGALVALMHVPEGVRVTLRIHSMDALSSWVHLIDWSRVDNLVFVSDHLRDVVQRLLGDRLAATTVHVVPNTVDTSRIPEGKDPGHLRRLLIIGWAQPVKDPLWALDVLSSLRQHDPQWTLVLVGSDFSPGTVTSGRAYAARFRERLTEPDVCGGVEFVAPTSQLAPHLRSVGFVVSSSRRESFGLGLVEGVASGAVPVVRNWPVFASLDGARRLFPQEWVVDTVEAAVERILAHAEAQAWAQASASGQHEVEQRFLSSDPARTLTQIVLGEDSVPEQGMPA